MLTLEQLNSASVPEFVRLLSGVYGPAEWVVSRAAASRPFGTLARLQYALCEVVRSASRQEQVELVRNADDAAPPRAKAVADAAELERQDASYRAKFGWPFVLAPLGPRGTHVPQADMASALRRRLAHHPDDELAEAVRELHRTAQLRMNERFGFVPGLGAQVWDWAEALAAHSDPGFADQGQLTVTYLTHAHRACAAQLTEWMREECGFDEVEIDAVGNVVGVYHGSDSALPRLLTGSHYDTVRNGGKYDGRLGILVPMACVQALHRAGRRLPHGIEVVGFAEEEGQRYTATFLGSGAVIGQFDPAWLEQADSDGITMREAMTQAGLDLAAIPSLRRDPARYLGFVEVHIEQGPVLNAMDLPLGVVSSINGSVRYVGEIVGMASHAGTTPMDRRRDAALAVAGLALYVERRAASVPEVVGTVGMLEVPGGSINVVPGRCRFSLDLRATTDAARDAFAHDVLAELGRICSGRGVTFNIEETMRASAAPSAPAWQHRWERAVESLGLPVWRMPSGAGHDAMKLHEAMPQAMLFVRGLNGGISHNPLEAITADDAELAIRAFQHLLDHLTP
jgi:beta-ureidopropionase / N-carbamoyl-L-amino-acid hydrolase